MAALRPFWIYWGALILGCIVFFMCPLLFFVFLPVLLILLPIWAVSVYLIGNAVQRRGKFDKIVKRIGLSILCSFLTVMIFPVCSWVDDIMNWGGFQIESFLDNFKDMIFWIMFGVHFFAFWIGEETRVWFDRNVDLQNK